MPKPISTSPKYLAGKAARVAGAADIETAAVWSTSLTPGPWSRDNAIGSGERMEFHVRSWPVPWPVPLEPIAAYRLVLNLGIDVVLLESRG